MPVTEFSPTLHADGTIGAILAQPAYALADARLLPLLAPAGIATDWLSGRYLLARCGAQSERERAEHWSLYLRQALYITRGKVVQEEPTAPGQVALEVILSNPQEPGMRWLAEQPAGAVVNLLGPLGQGYQLHPTTRNLLLVTDTFYAPILLALAERMLDRNGRVTLLIQAANQVAATLREYWPIPVELRLATSEREWQHHLQETIRWSDQLCIALPNREHAGLLAAIRKLRFHLDGGYAQTLVQTDLLCGVGACLACVVPTPDGGYTRACIHGPVFDLAQLHKMG
jgi:dihydroorotate dehydrogenase electron transfer subunit